jgi:hypothetical protein
MADASNFNDSQLAIFASGATAGLTAVTVANVAGTVPAGGTGSADGGWDTSGHRDTAIATTTETLTVLNALLAALDTMGLPITVT